MAVTPLAFDRKRERLWCHCNKCEGSRTPVLGSHDVAGPCVERTKDGLRALSALDAMSMPSLPSNIIIELTRTGSSTFSCLAPDTAGRGGPCTDLVPCRAREGTRLWEGWCVGATARAMERPPNSSVQKADNSAN